MTMRRPYTALRVTLPLATPEPDTRAAAKTRATFRSFIRSTEPARNPFRDRQIISFVVRSFISLCRSQHNSLHSSQLTNLLAAKVSGGKTSDLRGCVDREWRQGSAETAAGVRYRERIHGNSNAIGSRPMTRYARMPGTAIGGAS